jgi:hypothetical protein
LGELILDEPAFISGHGHLALVKDVQAPIAVLPGEQALPGAVACPFSGERLGLGPIQPEETPGAAHWFPVIHRDGIMDG